MCRLFFELYLIWAVLTLPSVALIYWLGPIRASAALLLALLALSELPRPAPAPPALGRAYWSLTPEDKLALALEARHGV